MSTIEHNLVIPDEVYLPAKAIAQYARTCAALPLHIAAIGTVCALKNMQSTLEHPISLSHPPIHPPIHPLTHLFTRPLAHSLSHTSHRYVCSLSLLAHAGHSTRRCASCRRSSTTQRWERCARAGGSRVTTRSRRTQRASSSTLRSTSETVARDVNKIVIFTTRVRKRAHPVLTIVRTICTQLALVAQDAGAYTAQIVHSRAHAIIYYTTTSYPLGTCTVFSLPSCLNSPDSV